VYKQGGKEGEGGDTLYERKKKVEGIKNWFRDCMDMNVGDDEALKGGSASSVWSRSERASLH
jgi:hypothetical protein